MHLLKQDWQFFIIDIYTDLYYRIFFLFCTYRFDPFMHVTSQYKGNSNNISLLSFFFLLAPAHLSFHEFQKAYKIKQNKK